MNFFLSNYEASQLNQQFNEAPVTLKIKPTIFTSSINTSQIDQYRQGVEITTQKHFDLGTFKVHSGEIGHILKREYLNDDPIFRYDQQPFIEIDTFDPIEYIKTQDDINQYSIYVENHTWPVVTRDSNLSLLYDLNGIVEIFDIRDIINFKRSQSRGINGSIEFGTFNSILGSSEITTQEYFIHNNNPVFFDSSENNTLDNIPVVNNEITRTTSYIEQELTKNLPNSLVTNSDMILALNQILTTTSTYKTCDSYIEYNKISATTGFVYDSVQGTGTDSLAFGGFTF
jgi:hypothetical protein